MTAPDPPIVRRLRYRLFELAIVVLVDLHYFALRLGGASRWEARTRALAALRRAMGEE